MAGIDKENISESLSDHSSRWKVTSVPQDSSIIPTIAVSLWTSFGLVGNCTVAYICLLAPWKTKVLFLIYFIALYLTMDVHYNRCATFSMKNSIYIVIVGIAVKLEKYGIALMAISSFLPREFPGELGKKFGDWIMIQSEKYFALKTTLEDESSLRKISKEGRAAVFALEPHDILPFGVVAFSRPVLRRLPSGLIGECQVLMASAIFTTPFLKHISSWVCGGPIDKSNFRRSLRRGESVVIIPGGMQEVIVIDPDIPEQITLYLKKRKGFVKLALEHGSPIVPVFAFKVDGSYGYRLPRGKFINGIARHIGFLPLFFWGRFGIPFGIPRPQKLHVVIGKPIELPCEGRDVKEESVNKYHRIFLKELHAIFERHKAAEGYNNRQLKIV